MNDNKLENIPFERLNNSSNIFYSEWRKTLRPLYKTVWRDIFLGYTGLTLTTVTSFFLNDTNPKFILFNILICSILFGFIFAYLALFLHEAAHFNLLASKKKNDLFASVFLCILFGINIKAYRKIHWMHHVQLGTTSDTENSYFNDLTPKFIFESLVGIHLIKVLSNRNSSKYLTRQMRRNSIAMLMASGFANLLLILFFVVLGYWPSALAWLIAMLIIFPFFATLRQILEHRSERADKNKNYFKYDHGKVTRIFTSDFFSKVFGAAGFNKHMIHHWDPAISYTRLKDVELFLLDCEQTTMIVKETQTSYFKTLKKLLVN